MIRFRRRRTDSPRPNRPMLPGFWHGLDRRTDLSLAEAARDHGAADIVTSLGLVLSLR